MKPPKPFKIPKHEGYSECDACKQWKHNNHFYHEGRYFTLCEIDYTDYWESTDKLESDYEGY